MGCLIVLYRDTMLESGFNEEQVEEALNQTWVWREAHVAETDERAFDEFLPAFAKASKYMAEVREKWNPPDQDVARQVPPLPRSAYGPAPDPSASEALVGSPKRVAAQISQLKEAGARNLMLTNRGLMSADQTFRSMRLLSEEIAPQFR